MMYQPWMTAEDRKQIAACLAGRVPEKAEDDEEEESDD